MTQLTPSEIALLERAQHGDTRAFDELVAPYRSELVAYCYRLIGSFHDAEDVVQETLLRAWKQLHTFRRLHSFRAWVYKIATNVCLTALARLRRRPPIAAGTAEGQPLIEPVWFEPFPDELLSGHDANPEAIYALHESVTLAFLVALQVLPPKQRAVLILHDVLDWRAVEIATFLATTVSAVNSILHRARTTLSKQYHSERTGEPAPLADARTQELLQRYTRAWEDADVELLATILKDDALFTMPPLPSWFRGRDVICAFVRRELFRDAGPGFGRLVPVRANAQPAFALYQYDAGSGRYRAFGVSVLTLREDAIAAITTFLGEESFPRFHAPLLVSP
jgi:RNA polymerase sigma-70 factor (ECF subfamily)